MRAERGHIAFGVDSAIAAGDFLGKRASVGRDRAAPARGGPGQRATGAALAPEQAEFFRFAIGQHHHMVGLDGLGNLFSRQVQPPVDGIRQPELGDLLVQLFQVITACAERHFGGGATGQRQAHTLTQLGGLLENSGQGLQQVFNAFAPVDKTEVQQVQRIHGR